MISAVISGNRISFSSVHSAKPIHYQDHYQRYQISCQFSVFHYIILNLGHKVKGNCRIMKFLGYLCALKTLSGFLYKRVLYAKFGKEGV